MRRHIALIGDYSAAVPAHLAIPVALQRATTDGQLDVSWKWIATRDLHDPPVDLAGASGIWVVPASPYENPAGVLAAIRWARETRRPFLGTCGGFQHALIEYARNVLHLTEADHAETNPTGKLLVVDRLSCSLAQPGLLHFVPGSRIQRIYGRASAEEAYRCNFGLKAEFRSRFEAGGLRFAAFDESGDPRSAELAPSEHPFYIGTLFQPERAVFLGTTPPLVRAFVEAVTHSPP